MLNLGTMLKESLQPGFEALPKGILLDVDGTLTNRQKIVSERVAKAITELANRDIKIGVSTGRSYPALLGYILPLFPPESLHVVAGGGQIISAEGKTVWERIIPHKQVVNICSEVERAGAGYVFGQGPILYCSKELLVNFSRHPWPIDIRLTGGLKDWSTPLISILDLNEKVRNFLSQQKTLSVREIETDYRPPYFDITVKGINKGSTARIWARKQGISLKDILAVGDSINDLELMQVVGLSAAMGQSPEKIKSVAQVTIGDTDEEGLAEYLEQLLNL